MIHCDKKSHQPEDTEYYSVFWHLALNVSQPHVSQALTSGAVHHPSPHKHLTVIESDWWTGDICFFFYSCQGSWSPSLRVFWDTRVGDNIYRAWNGGDHDGDALSAWRGTELSGEYLMLDAGRPFGYTRVLVISLPGYNFRIEWIGLVVGCRHSLGSIFIWRLTSISTNNQPEQNSVISYQPIQGINSTAQSVMPRIHGSKR